MADKPILFSGPMVRALLGGPKTQTRRVLKPQPFIDNYGNFCTPTKGGGASNWGQLWNGEPCVRNYMECYLPYAVGDRLYVREACKPIPESRPGGYFVPGSQFHGVDWFYRADRNCPLWADGKWHNSIHMPRSASRITLLVTDVRVQRLQDISRADVLAEGTPIDPYYNDTTQDGSNPHMVRIGLAKWQSPRAWYHTLWDSLNAAPKPRYAVIEGAKVITHYESYPWDSVTETREHRGKPWHVAGNPWVAAYTFTVHMGNIDAMALGDRKIMTAEACP